MVRLVFVVTLLTTVLVAPAGFVRARQDSTAGSRTLRMIVVGSATAAESIRARLAEGESFAVIARAESTDATGAAGGWLGRMSTSVLRPEVRAALEGLSPGAVTDVVRVPIGFALFKVEEDEPATADAATPGAGLAASGAVKFVYDFGGFTEARASLEAHARNNAWRMDSQAACEARTDALATTHRLVEEFFASGDQTSKSSLDLMQLHVGLAQLHAYEGRMDRAISRLHEARKIAMFGVPDAVLQMEQALGIAHLHKAGLDNHVHETPGELCLLDPSTRRPYPVSDDVERAVAHFTTYLESQPDNLEVRWLLNLAHMARGTYPDGVPARHLLPAPTFASAEDVGRFRDVAKRAGLISIGSAGGVIVEDLHNRGRFDVVTSMSESCGPMRLLASNGDGTFSDRTPSSGLRNSAGSTWCRATTTTTGARTCS